MNKARIITIAVVTFLASIAHAEEGIITDRPDAAESSRTVGAGHFQIETGVDGTIAGESTAFGFPTKVRVGVIAPLELHLETDIWTITSVEIAGETVSDDGVAPLDVGGKAHFFSNQTVSLGALAALTIPLDDTQDFGVTALVAIDFSLTDLIGLGSNFGVAVPFGDGEVVTGLYAVALGVDLPPVPGLGLFVETFGGVNEEAFSMLVDGGATYGITNTLQLDAYARTGVVNDETDIGFGAGVSAKF
jgi:hypothetical protein